MGRTVVCCIAALLLVAARGEAASGGGQRGGGNMPQARTIEGTVTDRAGRRLAGATVLIEDLKSLEVRTYVVPEDGQFHFRGLSRDASYQVRAHFHGTFSRVKTVSVFEGKAAVVVNLVVGPAASPSSPAPSSPAPSSSKTPLGL